MQAPRFLGRNAGLEVDAENIDGVVLKIARVGLALDEDGAELVGKILDDPDHRQAQNSGGSGDFDRIAQRNLLKLGEVVGDNEALPFGGQAVHGDGITRDDAVVDAARHRGGDRSPRA